MVLDVRTTDPETFGLEPPPQVTADKSARTCDQYSLCGHRLYPAFQTCRFYQQFDAAAFREIQDNPIKVLSIQAPEENSPWDAAGTELGVSRQG